MPIQITQERIDMGVIFYILGKSSSGKDTIYKRILEKYKGQLKQVIPYTTRPIRSGEISGREYNFVNEEGFEKLRSEGKIIEDRAYNTIHGLWRYFTVCDEQLQDIEGNSNYLMIGVLESYMSTKDYFGEEKVIPLYIEVEDGLRLTRALGRERIQEQPKYKELCRRFLADCEDFSEDKLQLAGIDKFYVNDDLEECLLDIQKCIDSILKS